jgi:hypothetical protein
MDFRRRDSIGAILNDLKWFGSSLALCVLPKNRYGLSEIVLMLDTIFLRNVRDAKLMHNKEKRIFWIISLSFHNCLFKQVTISGNAFCKFVNNPSFEERLRYLNIDSPLIPYIIKLNFISNYKSR